MPVVRKDCIRRGWMKQVGDLEHLNLVFGPSRINADREVSGIEDICEEKQLVGEVEIVFQPEVETLTKLFPLLDGQKCSGGESAQQFRLAIQAPRTA